MLGLFRRKPVERPGGAEPDELPPERVHAALQQSMIATAKAIAFHSMQVELNGDHEEARALLGDAGEFLARIGGPRRPASAEAIYRWCADREVGEA